MGFNCTKCGACCRAINCPYLAKDNTCSIYENRPDVCRVDKGYVNYGYVKLMTREQYYRLNEEVCLTLQQQEKQT